MTKLKIVSDNFKSLKELDRIERQDEINNETKELPSISRTSFINRSIALGAITLFISAFDPDNITVKHQEYFLEKPSDEQVICDITENTDILSEIEKDIEAISTLQNPRLEELIDGDEIKEEMGIIANYMSNVEKYYETRKKRFKI